MTKIELLNKLKIFVKKVIQKLEKLLKDSEIFNNITEIIILKVKNLSFNKQAVHYNTTITTKNVEIPNYKKYLEIYPLFFFKYSQATFFVYIKTN